MLNRQNWRQSDNAAQRRTRFRALIQILSSARFEGRAPGTEGGRRATAYLAEQFAQAGLSPAGEGNSFYQRVSLAKYQSQTKISSQSIRGSGRVRTLSPSQFVAWSARPDVTRTTSEQTMFVGYGIQAPEYQWDDYRDLDVSGRIVVMLTGDPPSRDQALFKGSTMSRHGRWDHKLTLAAERGASAAILIHDAKAAGYPFSAVTNTFGDQRIKLTDPLNAKREPAVSVWMSAQGASELLAESGITVAMLKEQAQSRATTFQPLPIAIQIEANTSRTEFDSVNVIGKLIPQMDASEFERYPGMDSLAPIALVAHWDHLGQVIDQSTGKVTSFFPGAADNASGLAQLLDVAGALSVQPERLRPILFVALTAEESGLLGARHFVRSLPEQGDINRPVAAINIDIANVFGRAQDLEVIGLGLSTMDDSLIQVARDQQRLISPDYAPQIGRLFRSDQYEFIRHGIPALWIRGGRKSRTFSLSNPFRNIKQYLREGYHQTGDTIRDWWNIDAALEDANLIAVYANFLANNRTPPVFLPGSPYLV